jgi:hypothetical protein
MLEGKRYRLAKGMRWAARAIGLLAAGFLLVFLIGETEEPLETAGILLALLQALALAGAIVSWWRERLASTLLILAAIGLGIHIGFYAGRNHFLAWLMVGLPYLVAGGLFLTSWRLSRKIPQPE